MDNFEILAELRKRLKGYPIPFAHISGHWFPAESPGDVRNALVALEASGEAAIDYGFGWRKI